MVLLWCDTMARSDVKIRWIGETASKLPVVVMLSSPSLEDLEVEIDTYMLAYPPEDHGTVAGGITETHEHGFAVHVMLVLALRQDISKWGLLAQVLVKEPAQ
jgi:hypothetical protein